jgi:hypothetical protein
MQMLAQTNKITGRPLAEHTRHATYYTVKAWFEEQKGTDIKMDEPYGSR